MTPQIRGGCLVLLRHGESTTNAAGVFTGLLDVDLTSKGEEQAVHAGRWLSTRGFALRAVYTSDLRRAEHTAQLTVAAMGIPAAARPPIRRCSCLAERHYGALTGRN